MEVLFLPNIRHIRSKTSKNDCIGPDICEICQELFIREINFFPKFYLYSVTPQVPSLD